VFKMFVDIDLDGRALDPASSSMSLEDVIHTVISCMNVPAPETCSGAVIASRFSNGSTEQKRGAHIVWEGEGAYVNKTAAKEARDTCVARCNEKKPGPDWANIIDVAVYNNNGLRMLFSRKPGSRADYRPSYVWCAAEERVLKKVTEQEWTCALPAWLDRFSIHVPQPQKNEVDDNGSHATEEDSTKQFRPLPTYGLRTSSSSASGQGGEKNVQPATEQEAGLYAQALAELRDLLPDPYKTSRFTGVRRTPSGAFIIFVNSRFCGNLGKEHRSNRVYLLAGTKGVFQGCTCTCDTHEGRKYGKCADVRVRLCAHFRERAHVKCATHAVISNEYDNPPLLYTPVLPALDHAA